MKKQWLIAALGATVALGAAGYVGLRMVVGPTGSSQAYGGDVESKTLADFPSQEPQRWVNGAPQTLAAQRGQPVLIEAWAPG